MRRRKFGILVLAVVIFALDRLIKGLVATHMVPGQSVPVLPPVLWITYITNSGAAFSILQHGAPLFIAIGVVILVGLVVYLRRHPQISRLFAWGSGLLAGGTAGNLWDRIVAGRVIDYIHFRYFAIFNLADSAIVVGIALIVIEFWRKDQEDGRSAD